MLLEEEYARDKQHRAYSFGEPVDSCHFGLVCRRDLGTRLDGHDDEQSIITVESITL